MAEKLKDLTDDTKYNVLLKINSNLLQDLEKFINLSETDEEALFYRDLISGAANCIYQEYTEPTQD